jgi:DNA-binding IclR family transcriptional regulator
MSVCKLLWNQYKTFERCERWNKLKALGLRSPTNGLALGKARLNGSGILKSKYESTPKSVPLMRRSRPGSSANRVLGVLSLFTVDEPVWSIDKLVAHLEMARATVYRYVKALCDAGFLVPAAHGGYVLGPRFIELDRQIRLSDPLLLIGRPIMEQLRKDAAGAQLLCSFYGDRVLCIHQEITNEDLKLHMDRGRPFPLFRGAPSRMILALLPSYQIRNLYLNYPTEIAAAGLGGSWAEFRTNLKDIRRAGYCVSGDVDKRLIGAAAPIFRAPSAVTASFCVVRLKKQVNPSDMNVMINLAVEAAGQISNGLASFVPTGSSKESRGFPAARVGR